MSGWPAKLSEARADMALSRAVRLEKYHDDFRSGIRPFLLISVLLHTMWKLFLLILSRYAHLRHRRSDVHL